jgi:alkanesulfonate monooxygenase SsuD/methylene tetrahydromethanopterin reductase-like flavin-dependent oxidoreductase (luciferase family)
MVRIGYHASHEEMPPGDLLTCVERAAAAGFQAAMCSDHLAPWSTRQGHSGHSWAWLGAAMTRTDLRFGVVTSPVGRQHPVVVA